MKGEFSHGMMHGKGVLTWKDGTRYDGDFVDNTVTGTGTYTWPDRRFGVAGRLRWTR